MLGSQTIVPDLGRRFARKYPSVYHLFQRIRDSMPSFGVDSISAATKVDIVAYLLQQNGFPSGPEVLKLDVGSMKAMKLSETAGEEGFDKIFNGRDFTGIKFLLGPNCRPAPEGCGRTEPGPIFWIENRELVTSGKLYGYCYTEKKYLNFTLRYEFRHTRPVDLDPDDEYYEGNNGTLLFINDHRVWPKGIEIQGKNTELMRAFGMDARVTAKDYPEAREKAYKPVGQWHKAEIVSKDGQVRSYLNGLLISHVTEHEFKEPGHIAFQSEGAEFHWRNLRIRVE
jgi:hypothetical protein